MFRYVSNAGIVIKANHMNIGIDCLCRDYAKLYQDTPMEIRQGLKLDVLIFTHEHEDHFCAEYVKEALEKNTTLQIYAGKKIIEILESINIPAQNLNEVRNGQALDISGLHMLFLQSVHEGQQYVDVQNFTLLIKYDEKTMVIIGDAMPCENFFKDISYWSKKIDWLLAPFPYVGLRSTRKLLAEYLDIQNIFVLHLPRKEADTQNWAKSTKQMCEKAKDGLPIPIFPEKLGNWCKI